MVDAQNQGPSSQRFHHGCEDRRAVCPVPEAIRLVLELLNPCYFPREVFFFGLGLPEVAGLSLPAFFFGFAGTIFLLSCSLIQTIAFGRRPRRACFLPFCPQLLAFVVGHVQNDRPLARVAEPDRHMSALAFRDLLTGEIRHENGLPGH